MRFRSTMAADLWHHWRMGYAMRNPGTAILRRECGRAMAVKDNVADLRSNSRGVITPTLSRGPELT